MGTSDDCNGESVPTFEAHGLHGRCGDSIVAAEHLDQRPGALDSGVGARWISELRRCGRRCRR